MGEGRKNIYNTFEQLILS